MSPTLERPMMGHKTEWSRTIGGPALRRPSQPRGASGSTRRRTRARPEPRRWTSPSRERSARARPNDSAEPAQEVVAESPRPDAGRGCPQTFRPAPDGRRFSALGSSGPGARRDGRARRSDATGAHASSVSRRGPFTNRTTLSHALRACSIADRAGPPGTARSAGMIRPAMRWPPWTGGVHNRFAGRPEPMVWRPSGEICFMAWTRNRNRSRGPSAAALPGWSAR